MGNNTFLGLVSLVYITQKSSGPKFMQGEHFKTDNYDNPVIPESLWGIVYCNCGPGQCTTVNKRIGNKIESLKTHFTTILLAIANINKAVFISFRNG